MTEAAIKARDEAANDYLIEPDRIPFVSTTRGHFKAGWDSGYQFKASEESERVERLLNAVKSAYLKHNCGDDSIGWNELGDILHAALCNEMGDKEFVKWVEGVK